MSSAPTSDRARGSDASAGDEPRGSQTIWRATEIIDYIADAPRTLADVAARFGVHRSTVLRQLRPLERAGFVLHRADGHYAIGPRIISIAQQSLDAFDLRRVAHAPLRELHDRVGDTIHLAQLVERSIIYVDKIEDTSGVRMYSRIGKLVLPTCTGVGKAILSRLAAEHRDEVLKGADWTPHTATTITNRADLDRELDAIAERGWAVDNGEFEEFTNCVAAPVANATGTIVGAISLTSIRIVHDLAALTRHVDDLLATAARISAQLG